MANLFNVYNDGLLVDHTADTTYDKVQVTSDGLDNKTDVPGFKTNPTT